MPELPPLDAVRRLRGARNSLLQSQVPILDLAEMARTEAARLDFPEARGKRLAEAIGRPEIPVDKSTNLFDVIVVALEASDRRLAEERATQEDGPETEPASPQLDAAKEKETQDLSAVIEAAKDCAISPNDMYVAVLAVMKMQGERPRANLMLESLLITSVAQFETFVQRLITISIRVDPTQLKRSGKEYLFEEIFKHGSLDEFVRTAADTYVDNLMHDGIDKWMGFLAGATRSSTDWVLEELSEVFMRRHVHVHASGLASKQYIDALGKKGASVKLGDPLPVTIEYLRDALDRMAVVALVLSQAGIMAVAGSVDDPAFAESSDLDIGLVDASFDLLFAGRYGAVGPLFTHLEPMFVRATNRERVRANSFQARKAQHGLEVVRLEISQWDVSASEDPIVLAKHCLLEEMEAAIRVYRPLAASGRITLTDLARWPILAPLREALSKEQEAEPPSIDGGS